MGKAGFFPIDGYHCTDEFVGAGLSVARYEEIAISHIAPKLLALEAGLNRTKWFDYRLLHPTQATYLFAHYYIVATSRAFKKFRDVSTAPYKRGFSGEDILRDLSPLLTEKQTAARRHQMTSFWKARQFADGIGVPYLLFISDSMEHALEMGWSQFPRPHQLACKPYLVEHMKETWKKRCESSVQVADAEFFHSQGYRKQVDQIAHMKWLITSVQKARRPAQALANLVYEQHAIPENVAIAMFGQEKVAEAKSLIRFLPA